MVLAERNSENVRNGRRSRGPSPNGHPGASPASSSDDENSSKKIGSSKSSKTKTSEYEAEKIRVGRDYQAVCPELIPVAERKPDIMNDRALLVWSPTKDIPETRLEEYISVAKDKYGYNGEQALGMLFWHKHDLERAVLDLANFTPFPDEWTAEDKVLFEQAFQFHGKSFHRIRQMLPDKTIASLVKFYYSWKKTRNRTSVMDRKEIKKNEGSENGSENGSNEESDNEEKKWPLHRGIRRASGSPPPRGGNNDDSNSTSTTSTNQAGATGNSQNQSMTNNNDGNQSDQKGSNSSSSNNNHNNNNNNNNQSNATNNSSSASSTLSSSNASGCAGCGVACNHVNHTPQGKLCNSCYHHWRRTGSLRPTSGPYFGKRSKNSGNNERHKRKPPRGMHINHDDIVALATTCDQQGNRNDDLLANMDREIVSLWSQIQNNRQLVSSLKRKNSESLEDLRPVDQNPNRISSRWNNEELLLGVQGVRKFGKDFQSIADSIGTKTEAQVRTFFVNYRRRYNLDNQLKLYEADRAQQQNDTNAAKITTGTTTTSNTSVVTVTTTTNGQSNLETEIMAIDLDDEPSPIASVKEKDVDLKSSADVSIIPMEKTDTDVAIPQSILGNTTLSSEISILPCTNNKSVTVAK